ncbi:hypothetical protein BCR44DRAFT_1068635 [Catenaria anguillulae PL171]|uniref:Uncharacterized protein n=1 Tax=Catenaria anguillulae PL171 TaxID=765915 RepID=A0A1Y2HSC8_9FUNG|nr:hypothetical protein BCR44DRAFT_1068635 [Catenaria anguillulae PL171]
MASASLLQQCAAPANPSTPPKNMLVPYLHALPRSCIPHVSLAVIMQCPWIDANVASLTNNLWLLELLGNKLARAPYNRPMQYDDTLLLDKVSGKGFVHVLDWWHKSDYVIGHDNPLKEASDGGHVHVLQWWLESSRLGDQFPDPDEHSFDLLEPTKKGDMQVLTWWLDNVLKEEMDLNDEIGEGTELDSSRFLYHSFAEAMWVALQAGRMELVDWWIDICMHYSGISDKVMSVFFASGKRELVAKYCKEYVECGGNLAESFPFVAFSGDVEYIEHCRQMLGTYSGGGGIKDMGAVPARTSLYASCAGHEHVLRHLKSKGWARPSALWELTHETGVFGFMSSIWTFLPMTIYGDSVRVTMSASLSPLEVVAQQGHLGVLQWWGLHFRSDLEFALMNKELLKRVVGMALANNHLALLDWLLIFTRQTALEFSCKAASVAAYRGYLSAVQWYLNKGPCDMILDFEGDVEEIIHQAMVGGRFEIVEWLMDNRQEKFTEDAFHTIYEVLLNEPRAHAVEWCWKNARRLPKQYGNVVKFELYDSEPGQDLDYSGPTAQDLWLLLGFIDAKAVSTRGKLVKFVTAVLDEEVDFFADPEDGLDDEDKDEVIKLLDMWKGYPLFLERLLAKRKRVLTFPLDLDLACEADAGVAVLDWMYARNKAEGTAMWSGDGYQALCSTESKYSMQWWEQKQLPQEPREGSEFDEDDYYDDDYYDDDGGSASGGSGDYSDEDEDDDDSSWEDESDRGDSACPCGDCGLQTAANRGTKLTAADVEDKLVADLVWAEELWNRIRAMDLDNRYGSSSESD